MGGSRRRTWAGRDILELRWILSVDVEVLETVVGAVRHHHLIASRVPAEHHGRQAAGDTAAPGLQLTMR